MNVSEYQEEWLSAYLDDELTEEERQVVEQRLATDSAAQATLEELRRVRAMVAKLPSWNRGDLQFSIPSELPGSREDADDLQSEADNHSTPNHFEEVPRSLAGSDEFRSGADRIVAPLMKIRNANQRSVQRSMLTWIATAASALLMLGAGYLLWPAGGLKIARVDPLKQQTAAPASPALASPAAPLPDLELSRDSGNQFKKADADSAAVAGNDRYTELDRAIRGGLETGQPGQKGQVGQDSLGTPPLPRGGAAAPIASDFGAAPESAAKLSMNLPVETFPLGSEAAPSAPAAAPAAGMALSDRTALAELLPEPGAAAPADPRSADRARAIAPQPLAASLKDNNAPQGDKALPGQSPEKRSANTSPIVRVARSQGWPEDEVNTSLGKTLNFSNANRFDVGTEVQPALNQPQIPATGTLLMAAIRTDLASSNELFESVIASNQLTTVDQAAAAELAESGLAQVGSIEASEKAGLGEEARLKEMPRGRQAGMAGARRGNSLVLFVTRDEANRILAQLQETGQASAQVWRIAQTPPTPSPASTSPASNRETERESSNARPPLQKETELSAPAAPSNGNEKVILMLNGPPQ